MTKKARKLMYRYEKTILKKVIQEYIKELINVIE